MNMKKTIAAIAAGAVAVSAMATTVSALESKPLTYDLVDYVDVWTDGTVQISGTIADVAGGQDIKLGLVGVPADYSVTKLSVIFKDSAGGAGSKVFDYSNVWGSDNFVGSSWWVQDITIPAASLSVDGIYDVTIVATANHPYAEWGGSTTTVMTDLEKADASVYVTTPVPATETTTELYAAGATLTAEQYAALTDAQKALVTVNDNGTAGDTSDDTYTVGNEAITETTTTEATEATVENVVTVSNYKEPTKTTTAYPFMTDLNGESVTTRLADLGYVNVPAVLNDAIENYDSVTFTFNTAANGIKYDDAGDAYYDDNGDKSYMSFAQHLYTNRYDPENTQYVGFDWTGYNLFQGALVINENLTMSLQETDRFDWTATSLSFDWDAIKDGAMTSNDYALYIRTIKLATSQTWYWDNLVVDLTVGEEEDATSDAGVEADDEELTEDVAEEEVVEEVVEEEAEEEEVEVEVANPTTGNASVALAVIPVALAAAAVVAKKRS